MKKGTIEFCLLFCVSGCAIVIEMWTNLIFFFLEKLPVSLMHGRSKQTALSCKTLEKP